MKISKVTQIGIGVIVGVFVMVWGYSFLNGGGVFKNTMNIYAEYDFVGGLVSGRPVVANGINVGIVKKMYVKEDFSGKIVVILEVDGNLQIRNENVVAEITDADLLGNKQVVLSYPYSGCENGNCISDGDTIQGGLGSFFDGMTKDFDPIIEQAKMVYQSLDTLISTWKKGTFGEGGVVNSSKSQVQEIVSNLNAAIGSTNQLVEKSNGKVTRISENLKVVLQHTEGEEMKQIQANTSTFSANLEKADFNKTIKGVNQSIEQWNTTYAGIEAVQKTLGEIIQKVENGEGTLGKLLADSRLNTAKSPDAKPLDFKEIATLLEDIRLHPEKYTYLLK